MYKTVDSGLNWTTQSTPITTAFTGVSAVTSQSAFAVGSSGVIAQTSNGGTAWLTQNSGFGSTGAAQNLLATEFTDANHGFAVGTGGTILRTTKQTPPVTSMSVSPSTPDGSGGWYRTSPPVITLTPDQQAQSYYSWDSAGGPFSAYSGSLTAAEGAHALYYYSVNAANRVEAANSALVKTDRTAPSAPGVPSATPVDKNTVQISWNFSTDGASGIADYKLWYRIGAGASTLATTTSSVVNLALVPGLTPNTTYTFWVAADDVAGNTSANSATTDAKTLAGAALVTSESVAPPSADGLNGWYVTTPTVSFTVTPTVPFYTHYSWDSSAIATYTGTPVPMPEVGTHMLSFWSVDQANQRAQENTRTRTFQLDTTSPNPPTVTAVGAYTTSPQPPTVTAVGARPLRWPFIGAVRLIRSPESITTSCGSGQLTSGHSRARTRQLAALESIRRTTSML